MSGLSSRNPFVGPRPIQQGEELHGRSTEIRALYNLLQARRIVVLHSPSGAGKSSLVHAGLIPKLERGSFDVWKPIRVNLEPNDLEAIPAGTNRYLLSAMVCLEEELPAARRRSPAELSTLDFLDFLESRPRRKNRAGRPVVLLFDQFEEVLTVAPRALDAKREFFAAIGEALDTEKYWALFVIREDYLAAFSPFRDRIPTQLSNTFRIDLLGLAGAREAAVELAREGGRSFPGVDRLIRDLSAVSVQQADGSFVVEPGLHVEPVQLQVVCRRLWDAMPDDDLSIDEEDIEHYAGVSEALGGYYADAVQKIAGRDATVERAVREWVGGKLIVGGIRSQVRRESGHSAGLDNARIEQLQASYLVRTEQRAGANWFELSHDRLVEPVLQDNERWEQAHLHPLQVQAKLWVSGRRAKTLLLSTEALHEAAAWLEEHAGLLTEEELDYLQQSRELRADEAVRQRRQRALSGAIAAAGALAIVAAIVSFVLYRKAEIATADAIEQREKAEAEAERANTASLMAGARELLGLGLRSRAAILLGSVKDPERTQGWGSLAAAILRTRWFPESTRPHPGGVGSVAWSPDGAYIVSGSDDEIARIWRADGMQDAVLLRGHSGAVTSAAWSPDGTRIVTTSADETARIWSPDGTGVSAPLRGHSGSLSSAAWSPDGMRIVTASADGTARIWSADGSTSAIALRGHAGAVTSVAWSPDGAHIVTASDDGTARVWNADGSGEPIVLRHEAPVLAVAWSPDSTRIVTGAADKSAYVWRSDGTKLTVLEGHADSVTSVAWSPDASHILTASTDNTARVWHSEASGREATVLEGHSDSLTCAAWSPDGKRIATASADHTARVWNDDGSGSLTIFKGHANSVTFAAWSPDGTRIITASADKTARMWDAQAAEHPILTYEGHADSVTSVAWSPDGTRIATTSADRTAWIWPADRAEDPLLVLVGHAASVTSAAWSPDGTRIATASADKTARVWAADGSGDPLALRGHTNAVTAVVWSPDGTRIATASADRTARVWSADASGNFVPLEGHSDSVTAIDWSPDGTRILTASADKTARVWLLDGSQDSTVFKGHSDRVTGAAWGPLGKRIATASWDKTAQVWNVDGSGQPLILEGHPGFVSSVAWSPSGERIVTASADNTARAWPIDELPSLQRRIAAATTDCLTREQRETYLAEAEAEAEARHADCERSHGRTP